VSTIWQTPKLAQQKLNQHNQRAGQTMKRPGTQLVLMLAVLALLLVVASAASGTASTRQTFAEWQRSPSFHLRVLRRASAQQETCVVLAARYGQPHRGLTDAHHVLLFTYWPIPHFASFSRFALFKYIDELKINLK
jgi:hypothetical protein